MQGSTVRRAAFRVATLALSVAVVACGDSRIRRLDRGIARDSVLRLLAQGATPVAGDTTPNVYREERYLRDAHWTTVLFYTPTGAKEGQETVPENELTPIVLRDDTLTGWGWEHFDSVAQVVGIRSRPRGER